MDKKYKLLPRAGIGNLSLGLFNVDIKMHALWAIPPSQLGDT